MKKAMTLNLLLILSSSVFAINLEKLNVSDSVKDQLINALNLKQSMYQSNNRQQGVVATVGADVSCDFRVGSTRIQDAINSNATEIRVASNFAYAENLTISDRFLTIKGGYADCSAANTDTQTDRSTITGVDMAGLAVILIDGSSQRNTITLDSLLLQNGTGTGFFPGGGITTNAANAQVNLNNVVIQNSTTSFGGGVTILGGNTDFSVIDSIISNNVADTGGGLYCFGNEASFSMSGDSTIALNQAVGTTGAIAGKGGGVYVAGGCTFVSFSGTKEPSFSDLRGVSLNIATAEGGGLYVSEGSAGTIFGHQFCIFNVCIGNNNEPGSLISNRSDSDDAGNEGGGGAYVTDSGSQLNIYAGYVVSNVSGIDSSARGGAIAVNGGADFTTARLFKACWDPINCNYYFNNHSGEGNGFGGAIYNFESTVDILNTVFEGNRADFGTVIYGLGAGSDTIIKGSILHHNGNNGANNFNDDFVLRVVSNAQVDVQHTTIADNNAETAVFGIFSSAGESSLIQTSIIHDASTGPVYAASPGPTSLDCVMVHEDTSVPLQFFSSVDDPQFVDRDNNDYHLNAALSPALDYCFEENSDFPDMDFEDRGWDDPIATDNFGVYDLGADETYSNDIIFMNDFEQL